MNKVVLVNQSTRYLMIDIVNAFAAKYDEVVLIAGVVEEQERKLDSNVKVEWICDYDRSSNKRRLITWVKGYIQLKRLIKKQYKDYEVRNPDC